MPGSDKKELFAYILVNDRSYARTVSTVASHLNMLAESEAFKKAIEGDSYKAGEKGAGETASAQLKWIVEGLYDFINADDEFGNERRDLMYEGMMRTDLLETVLKKKAPSGITYLEALKIAADAEEESPEKLSGDRKKAPLPKVTSATLLDDLYYLDERLELDLKLHEMDPGSVVPKTMIPGDKSWGNYKKAHLMNVPHTVKGKQEYLAKAMTAALEEELHRKRKPGADAFSVKTARKYAEKLTKNKVFQKLYENPIVVRQLLQDGKKELEDVNKVPKKGAEPSNKMLEAVMDVYRPFYNISETQRREILRKLKAMEPLLDPPAHRSASYRALHESIRSINLDDPAMNSEQKLMEIMEKNDAYMKGKKAWRSTVDERRRFDQSLDILATLGSAGKAARAKAETVFERINEVRANHETEELRRTPGFRVNYWKYGPRRISAHTTADMETVKAFEKNIKIRPPKKNTEDLNLILDPSGKKVKFGPKADISQQAENERYVFQPYPKHDQSELPHWSDVKQEGDRPRRMHSMLKDVKEFTADSGKDGKGSPIGRKAAINGLAQILALSDCRMYHLPEKEVGDIDNFYMNKDRGKKLGGSVVVISDRQFTERYTYYLMDPAVQKLAEKYMDAGSRKSLTMVDGMSTRYGVKRNEEGKARYYVKGQEKKRLPSEDPHDIDIARLKKEYADIKKEIEKEKGVSQPGLQ